MKKFFSQKFEKFRKSVSTHPSRILNWALSCALFVITVYICFRSYTPYTSLTGWDTLHPEFNFPHAFSSLINGVWRSDQGLGSIAAHSHMSELPRVIYLYVASKVAPLTFLRYSYVFLTLILGPLGMFLFLRKYLQQKSVYVAGLAALVGSLYYALNLGTVGRYSVPFEMFMTQFAFLPFLFWAALSFVEKGRKKYAVLFGIISFLAAPQAYAATLFYAFVIIFGLSLLMHFLINKKKESLKRLVTVGVILFATNAFWLLPNLYSVRNQSTEISNAQINKLFTPEALLHNQAFGSFKDVITERNYLFNWQAYDFQNKQFVELLGNWNSHLSDSRVALIPLVFATLAIGGVVVTLFTRHKTGLAFLIPSALTVFFLMNNNGFLAPVYLYLQNHSGLFAEGFRDPFTKFSILLSFFISFYVSLFLSFVFAFLKKYRSLLLIPLMISTALSVSLIVLFTPAFKDGLVSPLMRTTIPQNYFDTFTWFKGKEGRVAQLPLNSLWGWQYNDWGYQGAGFFWFGIDNPYVTRDFDRWNSDNETLYNELSRAYHANDPKTFDNILEKYNIRYLVIDGSIFDPSSNQNLLSLTQKFLESSKAAHEVQSFGFIHIYETPFGDVQVKSPSVYSKVNSNSSYSSVDYTFNQYGTYVSAPSAVWKPFVNFDNRITTMTFDNDWVTSTAGTKELSQQVVTIPDIVQREEVLPVTLSIQKSQKEISLRFDLIQPKIVVDGNELTSSPVYLTTRLGNSPRAGIVSVENSSFDITSLPFDSAYHQVGSLYVNTHGKTKVALYTKNTITNAGFLPTIKETKASWCSDPSHLLPLSVLSRGFSLTSEDQSVCVGALVSLPSAALYETSYSSPTGSSSLFCLNKIGTDGCLNVDLPKATAGFGGRDIRFETPLEAGNYWFAFVGQSVPGTKSTAVYDNLSLVYHPQISQNYVDFGAAYGLFSHEQNIDLEKVHSISVSYFAQPVIKENFYLQRGHAKAVNCEVKQKGDVALQFLENSVRFSAHNGGVNCDYFDYPQLLQSQAYLMTLSGENSEGRSIKFYLQNKATNHMDMEELLPSHEFQKSYVLQPYEVGEGGFVVNLESRAVDSIPGINTLSGISFSPIPLKWLTEIAVGPHSGIVENNRLVIKDFKTKGILTTVTVEGKGILSFNQSVEKGWLAINQNGKLLEHISVNGWENGWNVPDGVTKIYIFYAPQVLEYIGFGCLIIATYSLIKRK